MEFDKKNVHVFFPNFRIERKRKVELTCLSVKIKHRGVGIKNLRGYPGGRGPNRERDYGFFWKSPIVSFTLFQKYTVFASTLKKFFDNKMLSCFQEIVLTLIIGFYK